MVIKKEGGGRDSRRRAGLAGSPGLLSAVDKAYFLCIDVFPAKVAGLFQLDLFAVSREQQLAIGGRADNVEQQVFHSAVLVLNVQERKVQGLH